MGNSCNPCDLLGNNGRPQGSLNNKQLKRASNNDAKFDKSAKFDNQTMIRINAYSDKEIKYQINSGRDCAFLGLKVINKENRPDIEQSTSERSTSSTPMSEDFAGKVHELCQLHQMLKMSADAVQHNRLSQNERHIVNNDCQDCVSFKANLDTRQREASKSKNLDQFSFVNQLELQQLQEELTLSGNRDSGESNGAGNLQTEGNYKQTLAQMFEQSIQR